MDGIIYISVVFMLITGLYFTGIFTGVFSKENRLKRMASKTKDFSVVKKRVGLKIKNWYPVKLYYENRLEEEILSGLAIMRNLIISSDEITMTTDSVLGKLAQNSRHFEEYYQRMLVLIRSGKTEKARAVFSGTFKTSLCEEYMNLIFACDEMEARLLMEILLSMQKSLREKGNTLGRKRDEIISDLLYVPAVFNVMLVFVNFIYVAYFLEQKEILSKLFL